MNENNKSASVSRFHPDSIRHPDNKRATVSKQKLERKPEPWYVSEYPDKDTSDGVFRQIETELGRIVFGSGEADFLETVNAVNACRGYTLVDGEWEKTHERLADPAAEIKAMREVCEAQIVADDAIDAYEKDDDLDPEVLGAALRRRRQAIDAYRALAAVKAEREVKSG